MQVYFYTFAKRINSTKQPTGSGSSYNCVLKDGCSVLAPEIKLDIGLSSSPAAFNYAYIPDFGRYYYVRWRWEDRLWIGQCTVDPMASFKSQIGAANCYIARSASAYNLKVVDHYYPCIAEVTESVGSTSQDPAWTRNISNGTYVIGVMGKNAGQNGGAVTYYAIKPAAVTAITNYLMDPQNLGVTEISDELLKCIFNPMQYIVSCMWYPFSMIMSSDAIKVGWWEITNVGSGNCKVLSDAIYTRNMSFTIPKHPQSSRGKYLNLAPFSRYALNCGPWGVIPLDNDNLIEASSLNCWINVDLFTGSGRLSIVGQQNAVYVEDHMAQIGVPIQLGQNMLNQGALSGTGSGIINTIKSAITGDPAGMVSNGLSAIGDAAALSQSVPNTVGSNGSLAFNTTFKLIGRFLTIADEDLQSRGRPLCAARTISTLSGFIMCMDADPEINCSDEELDSIVSYMNNGFFYE